ncbi:MAG: hypothetical protein JWO97_3295 [Acidobacteria bacterium]|nr:hypothetical protein [Acidobacteriota bacterium]
MRPRVLSSAAARMLLRIAIFSAGKTLTDPLLVILTLAAILLFFAARRTSGNPRRLIVISILLTIALWLLSTPLVSGLLTRSLFITPDATDVAPDVIVVASGGVVLGANPEFDTPSYASNARIIAGVQWWRQYPHARLVLAGADTWPGGRSTRSLEVMRDRAIEHGVPPSAIELETWSTSTREHPLGLLKLRGITPNTRVGVVSSAWHMRRAVNEFRRHFRTVIVHPVPARRIDRVLYINSILPDETSLGATTSALHEWIGSAWYALSR